MGASRRRGSLVVALLAALGCGRGSGGSGSNSGGSTADVRAPHAADAATPVSAPSSARDGGASAAPTAPGSEARVVFEGTATGTAGEPPIRAYVPRLVVAPWTGRGAVHLEVPSGNGAVTGTITLGDLRFDVRGYRNGAHVRGTLEQVAPTPRATDGNTGISLFNGTLDADVTGAALRGTWESSAEAGLARRHGTLEAQQR